MCGEKPIGMSLMQGRFESPPRVRGEAVGACQPVRRVGITPACAGRSAMCPLRWYSRRDHPRVCGEKLFHNSGVSYKVGSPPRVRGEEGVAP